MIPPALLLDAYVADCKRIVSRWQRDLKKQEVDATVTLPGGAGSLDELFEVLTWRQLGLHDKPVYILNTEGYWDPLMDLLNHVIARGFADESLLGYLAVQASAAETLSAIARTL